MVVVRLAWRFGNGALPLYAAFRLAFGHHWPELVEPLSGVWVIPCFFYLYRYRRLRLVAKPGLTFLYCHDITPQFHVHLYGMSEPGYITRPDMAHLSAKGVKV